MTDYLELRPSAAENVYSQASLAGNGLIWNDGSDATFTTQTLTTVRRTQLGWLPTLGSSLVTRVTELSFVVRLKASTTQPGVTEIRSRFSITFANPGNTASQPSTDFLMDVMLPADGTPHDYVVTAQASDFGNIGLGLDEIARCLANVPTNPDRVGKRAMSYSIPGQDGGLPAGGYSNTLTIYEAHLRLGALTPPVLRQLRRRDGLGQASVARHGAATNSVTRVIGGPP